MTSALRLAAVLVALLCADPARAQSGAAGAAILNAELLVAMEKLK